MGAQEVKKHLRHDIHKHNSSVTTAYAQANPMCGSSACVAVKNDGTAVAWGHGSYGGDASSVDLTNIAAAMCGGSECVAVKNDDIHKHNSSVTTAYAQANPMCGSS